MVLKLEELSVISVFLGNCVFLFILVVCGVIFFFVKVCIVDCILLCFLGSLNRLNDGFLVYLIILEFF